MTVTCARLASAALVALTSSVVFAQPTPAAPDAAAPPAAPVETPAAEPAPAPTVPAAEPAPAPTVPAAETSAPASEPKPAAKPWYERLAVRGYLQLRFNRLYASDDEFRNDLGDRAIAADNSFSIRRARLVVSGDVASFMSVYLQVEGSGADVKMRDWYGDLFLDAKKELRVRVGQSKIPYGWENLQSSQNRAPLDRSDPINSGAPGERDIGAFVYWAPDAVRKRFKHLIDSGLKGSGDYGVVGVGVYNGQTLNTDDKNENRHVVARVTYPLMLGSQILEVGGGGYLGRYNVTRTAGGGKNIRDMRASAAVVLYPQPIGFQAEYTIGEGPEAGVDGTIAAERLHGGYAMVIARIGPFYPFVRASYYDGGVKTETDVPHHETKELVVGTEWHHGKAFELTAELDVASRRVGGDEAVEGAIVRLQAQLNY